jgi:hypothetical protein
MMSLDGLCESRIGRVVALEPLDSGRAALFIREESGSVVRRDVPFKPFLLLRDPGLLNGLGGEFSTERLEGPHPFGWRAVFPDSYLYERALKHLKSSTGSAFVANAPYKLLGTHSAAGLGVQNNVFQGHGLPQLRRHQFDIETAVTPPYGSPTPTRRRAIYLKPFPTTRVWEKCLP